MTHTPTSHRSRCQDPSNESISSINIRDIPALPDDMHDMDGSPQPLPVSPPISFTLFLVDDASHRVPRRPGDDVYDILPLRFSSTTHPTGCHEGMRDALTFFFNSISRRRRIPLGATENMRRCLRYPSTPFLVDDTSHRVPRRP
jgi:hypothetical protein